MSRSFWVPLSLLIIVLVVSGGLELYLSLGKPPPDSKVVLYARPIIGIQLVCWMILGILANYFWDLHRAGKPYSDINYWDMMAPLFIAPFILYGIYTLVDETNIKFLINLVAFQNGFFWQTLFEKVKGPATTPPAQR
jgi:hypothetical protein